MRGHAAGPCGKHRRAAQRGPCEGRGTGPRDDVARHKEDRREPERGERRSRQGLHRASEARGPQRLLLRRRPDGHRPDRRLRHAGQPTGDRQGVPHSLRHDARHASGRHRMQHRRHDTDRRGEELATDGGERHQPADDRQRRTEHRCGRFGCGGVCGRDAEPHLDE